MRAGLGPGLGRIGAGLGTGLGAGWGPDWGAWATGPVERGLWATSPERAGRGHKPRTSRGGESGWMAG